MANEPSIYDLVVEELLSRQELVREEIRERFKKTKPFRQEPVSRKEKMVMADEASEEMTSEKEAQLRQWFGDEPIDSYKSKLGGGQNA